LDEELKDQVMEQLLIAEGSDGSGGMENRMSPQISQFLMSSLERI